MFWHCTHTKCLHDRNRICLHKKDFSKIKVNFFSERARKKEKKSFSSNRVITKTKSLLTSPSNVLPLHLKQTLPPIIWIFTEGEGDGINARLLFKIFSTLQMQTLLMFFRLMHCPSTDPKTFCAGPIIWDAPKNF